MHFFAHFASCTSDSHFCYGTRHRNPRVKPWLQMQFPHHITHSRVTLTTFQGRICLLSHPQPSFFSPTLVSLSPSSPRGQCQQEVGLGRHMKQSMRLYESCLTPRSKNETVRRPRCAKIRHGSWTRGHCSTGWTPNLPPLSVAVMLYQKDFKKGVLTQSGTLGVTVVKKDRNWMKEVKVGRVKREGKNEWLGFLLEKRKGEASSAVRLPDGWDQCIIQRKVH